MELEHLVHVLIEILAEYGNIKTFITTENEWRAYHRAECKVFLMQGEPTLKIEGLQPPEQEEIEEEDTENGDSDTL
jgi:hypothetical protein